MIINYSTGTVNALASDASNQQAIGNFKMLILNGSMAASADSAAGATVLAVLTKSGGAWTAETLAKWVVTFSGTPTGSTVTKVELNVGPFAAAGSGLDLLGGLDIAGAADLAATATAVAAAINLKSVFTAIASGAVVSIYAPIGSGTTFNSSKINVDITTGTGSLASDCDTDTAAATAGVAAANGCNFDGLVANGVITSSETWSRMTGETPAAGTATWFRIITDGADTGLVSSSTYRRIDGNITTVGGGGALELSTTTMLTSPSATPISVTNFQLEVPTAYSSI